MSREMRNELHFIFLCLLPMREKNLLKRKKESYQFFSLYLSFLFIIFYLLFFIYYFLFFIYYLLFIIFYLLFIIFYIHIHLTNDILIYTINHL